VDGWEEMLQVNALSTILLGLLVLPLLLATADGAGTKSSQPHLTFISSGNVWLLKPENLQDIINSEQSLQTLNEPAVFHSGGMPGQEQYSRSKMVLEYVVRHIAQLPSLVDPHGEPKVIIDSACPGFCRSDLARRFKEASVTLRVLIWLVYTLFARTTEQGANTYVSALTQNARCHGEMWKDDQVYTPGPIVSTEAGKKFGDKIWTR